MLNRMTLQGRLTRDVELRSTGSGTSVASFTVAWSEKFGETERKLFLPCVAWKNTAEFASRFFSKGSEIVAEGYLVSRKWTDNNGNNRETVELVAERLHFCGPKREASEEAGGSFEPSGFGTTGGDYAEIEDDGNLPF